MGRPFGSKNVETEVKQAIETKQEEVAPETPVSPRLSDNSSKSEQNTVVLRSELDAYVLERVKEQPRTIEDIEVKFDEKRSEASNLLALPKYLEKFKSNYSFRWINKKKRAIDQALDVVGWTFVTTMYFPEIPKHLLTANGVIERGDTILAFMPNKQAERIRLRPAEISRERVFNTPVQDLKKWKDKGEQYYKPDLGAAEDDNERTTGISVTPD